VIPEAILLEKCKTPPTKTSVTPILS